MSAVSAHILAYNEREIIPYAVRHYKTYCNEIVIHDLGSTDGTQKIATDAGARVQQHDCRGEFNDMLNKTLKNTCWHGTSADWVLCVDADELIYFPSGAEVSLKAYDDAAVPVVKPYGYEMFSDIYPTGDGQIYEYVKQGARDDFWYGKAELFSPKRVGSVDFGTGAHVTHAVLHGGRKILVDSRTPPTAPSVYLLHFKHIGGIERLTRLYAENQARQSAENKRMGWGNQEDPGKHARDKRRAITAKLERVIP